MTHDNSVGNSVPPIGSVPPHPPRWHYLRTQWRRAFGLNVSQINDLLFVGGQFRAMQWPQLAALGIRAVLSLQAEHIDEFAGTHPLRALRLPVADFHPPSVKQLHEATTFINAAHAEHLPVLIHCYGGVGRASLTASAFLMTQGISASAAFERIHTARPIVHLNKAQRTRLLEWSACYTSSVLFSSIDIISAHIRISIVSTRL